MRQIYCGGQPEPHFDRLGVVATKDFDGSGWYGERLTAWSLDPEGFQRLSVAAMGDGEEAHWRGNESWWRECSGSVLGPCNSETTINGHRIVCWNVARDEDEDECDPVDREWTHVLEYLCDHVGASTERNVAACLTDLAEVNGMTVGALLTLTMPATATGHTEGEKP